MFESQLCCWIYHVMAILACIISIFWIYLIVWKSTPEMKLYRWAMLKLAVCDFMFEVFLGGFLFPDILFPASGVAVMGWAGPWGEQASRLAVHGTFFWGLCILVAINDCCSVRSLLLHQQTEILEKVFSWVWGPIIVASVHLPLVIPLLSSIWFAMEDNKDFIARYAHTPYYRLIEWQVERNVTFISVDITKWKYLPFAVCVAGGCVALYVFNACSAAIVFRKLNALKSQMSAKTYAAHRSFMFVLLAQNMYPVFVMFCPCVITVIGFVFDVPEILESSAAKYFISMSLTLYPRLTILIGCLTTIGQTAYFVAAVIYYYTHGASDLLLLKLNTPTSTVRSVLVLMQSMFLGISVMGFFFGVLGIRTRNRTMTRIFPVIMVLFDIYRFYYLILGIIQHEAVVIIVGLVMIVFITASIVAFWLQSNKYV